MLCHAPGIDRLVLVYLMVSYPLMVSCFSGGLSGSFGSPTDGGIEGFLALFGEVLKAFNRLST